MRIVALGSSVLLGTLVVAPRSVARASDGSGLVIGLGIGEIAVLAGSLATTIAVSGCITDHRRPEALLIVPHFAFAAIDVGIGTLLTWIGATTEGDGLAAIVRTLALTFGILHLVAGVTMGVLGGVALTVEELVPDSSGMSVPLVLRWQ